MPVRVATLEDAEPAVALLRRSITELCVADHRNDPETLGAWLANKTVLRFSDWVADPERLVVVEEGPTVLRGVGLIHRSGEIRLCYVQPGQQRRGVGAALLSALEAQARSWSVWTVRLDSSTEARGFYARHGYKPAGEPACGFGRTRCYPLQKQLTP